MATPQKIKNGNTMWPSNSISGSIPKRIESTVSDICTPMILGELFTIAKMRKQPKYPSTDEWISKMWCIHTMEHYSAFKEKEVLMSATTWVSLKDSMLSEISQSPKDKYLWFYLFEVPRVVKTIKTEIIIVVARGLGAVFMICLSPLPSFKCLLLL